MLERQMGRVICRRLASGALRGVVVVGLLVLAPRPVAAQLLTDVPPQAAGLEIVQRLGESVPRDLKFWTESGELKALREVVPSDRPWLLTLNYSDCPGLCVVQLDAVSEVLGQVKTLRLGEDFHILSISIDPRDDAERLGGMGRRHRGRLPEWHQVEGWQFLRGDQRSILELAESVGFKYRFDAASGQFSHGPMLAFISPRGVITRYINSVSYEADTVRLAIVEASEGLVGSPFDGFLLWCFHYDPMANRYSADARKLLTVAAGAFVLMMVAGVAPFWLTRSRRPGEASAVGNAGDSSI
jgi:protein SCO1